jgi:rod shape-determining protein MreD
MKKILFLFFLLMIILFLYISFGYVFNINRVFIPDFWLVLVFFVALYYKENEAFGLVFLLGFFRDIFEIGIFGMNSFLFFNRRIFY